MQIIAGRKNKKLCTNKKAATKVAAFTKNNENYLAANRSATLFQFTTFQKAAK